MPALIALILANLPTIISAGEAGYSYIASIRAAAQQSGEWTPEIEAQFQAALAAQAIDPAWLNDVPTAPVAAPLSPVVIAAEAVAEVAKTIVEPPVTPPVETPAPVTVAAPVVCPTCNATLTPDSPTNCTCPN